MTTTKQLCFKIDGAWLTDVVRDLWGDGDGEKALGILEQKITGVEIRSTLSERKAMTTTIDYLKIHGYADVIQALQRGSLVNEPATFTFLPIIRYGDAEGDIVAVGEQWFDRSIDALDAAEKALTEIRAK